MENDCLKEWYGRINWRMSCMIIEEKKEVIVSLYRSLGWCLRTSRTAFSMCLVPVLKPY